MRRPLAIAFAALSVALVVGCSGGSDEASSADGTGGLAGGGGVAEPADAGGAPIADVDEDRQIVTTATASLAVDDPAEGAQRVSELVEAAGGRVDERSEQSPSGANE